LPKVILGSEAATKGNLHREDAGTAEKKTPEERR
jgi:hypothetical protein